MVYEVVINKKALNDIKGAAAYYDNVTDKLGLKFKNIIKEYIRTLKTNPHFKVKYKNVRVLPIKKFSYAIHFTVDESRNFVKIHGVIHTSRSPEIWNKYHSSDEETTGSK